MHLIGALGLLSLTGACVVALHRPSTLRVAVAAALAVLWLFINGTWEGPVLWAPVPGQGLTLSDLLTPVVLLLLTVRLAARRRSVQAER